MPVWLAILIGVVSIVSTIGNVIIALFMKLSKGNFAEFKLDLIQLFDDKLTSFVKKSDLNTYSESHAKEHKRIDEEIINLRTFKHDVGTEIRKTGGEIENIKDTIKEVKQDIKEKHKDD